MVCVIFFDGEISVRFISSKRQEMQLENAPSMVKCQVDTLKKQLGERGEKIDTI